MSVSQEDLSRREFLYLMAAPLALAGLAGCSSAPPEKIVPYVNAPESLVPGRPLFFATAMQTPGYGVGLLVESREGRPIKVEGNPDHPASLGATDAFAQAQLMEFYDPFRAATITANGLPSDWQGLLTALALQRARLVERRGYGLRILTGTVTSPTLAAQIEGVLAAYPEARWHQWEPISRSTPPCSHWKNHVTELEANSITVSTSTMPKSSSRLLT